MTLLSCAASMGCAPTVVRVDPTTLPDAVTAYQSDGATTVESERAVLAVTARNALSLVRTQGTCRIAENETFDEDDCFEPIRVDLELSLGQ